MDAKSAYESWKKSQLVNLRVYTDEQMFEIGFNTCQLIIKEMSKVIYEMEADAKKMNNEIKKLKKASKA